MKQPSLLALLAALAACGSSPPPFDCSRPGATCGDTPGAVCVVDRCAIPNGACPSGLAYDDNAGGLAGMCVPVLAGCGDGVKDAAEACDGDDLGGADCASMGFAGGELGCTVQCQLDTSACEAPPGCGDGAIASNEQCDGTNLGAANCMTFGFAGGALACTDACVFDMSGCNNCGNGVANPGEECDGDDFGGKGCADVGFDQGMLACTATCSYDTAACIKCGDGVAEGSEQCDGTDLKMNDCTTIGAGWIGGVLGCNVASCSFDQSMCTPPPNCPDGDIDPGEQCDGTNLGGGTCSSATGGVRPSGVLACGGGCQYDVSACYKCGDGVLHGAEVCDGTNFGGQTCVGLGHDGGSLTCAGTCLSISQSTCTDCGDGMLESPEVCDGALLGGKSCPDVGAFSGGTLLCNGTCNGFNTSMCTGAPTVPKLRKPMNNAYFGSVHVAGSRKPQFVWEQSTVSGGASIFYELQYSTDKSFGAAVTTTVSAGTFTNHTPASDLVVSMTAPVGARYYWRVRACAGSACSAYSAPWWVNVGRDEHDFNGDGYGDLAIGSPGADVGGMMDAGKVQIHFGAAGSTFSSVPGATISGQTASALFGRFVNSAGDVNGDGFADLIVANQDTSTNQATFLFLGGSPLDPNPDLTIPGDIYGFTAPLGDINADGFDDFCKGTASGTNVFFGSATPNASPDGTFVGVTLFGLVRLGDVNGDGFADIGAPNELFSVGMLSFEGKFDVYLGGTAIDTVSDYSMTGSTAGERVGAAMSGIGDVNSDGFGDVLIGRGQNLYVWSGSVAGITEQQAFQGGAHAARGADINGDGVTDVVIEYSGRVDVYLGVQGAGPSPASAMSVNGAWTLLGIVGRANNDLSADLAVSNTATDPGGVTNAGQVVVYFGTSSGSLSGPKATINGAVAEDNLGAVSSSF